MAGAPAWTPSDRVERFGAAVDVFSRSFPGRFLRADATGQGTIYLTGDVTTAMQAVIAQSGMPIRLVGGMPMNLEEETELSFKALTAVSKEFRGHGQAAFDLSTMRIEVDYDFDSATDQPADAATIAAAERAIANAIPGKQGLVHLRERPDLMRFSVGIALPENRG